MKNSIAFKFAIKNFKANKLLLIPYLIACSIMGGLFFIMTSLSQNKFVLTRHFSLSFVIGFGVVLVGIFSFVFMVYGNNFLIKRRNKEFSLYGILGLEKKHIAKILFIETIINFTIVTLFSVFGGYIMGKGVFLLLNKLMKEVVVNLMDYPFSMKVAFITVIFLFVIICITYFLNLLKIGKSTPIELLNKQKKSESEPKSKFLLALLGVVSLGTGYYLALTTKGMLSSLKIFFLAVLLVILGTYLLLTAFSIVFLKFLKSRRNLYYKDIHFISISGMLYRMKSNALSIASIAILSTSIIVVISTTMTIYGSIKSVVDSIVPKSYNVHSYNVSTIGLSNEKLEEQKKIFENNLNKSLEKDEKIKNLKVKESITFVAEIIGDDVIPLKEMPKTEPVYFSFELLETYNKNNNTDITLEDNEVLFSTNEKNLVDKKTFNVFETELKTRQIPDEIPKNMAAGSVKFVIKKDNFFKILKGNQTLKNIDIIADYDVENENGDYAKRTEKYFGTIDCVINSKTEIQQFIYGLDGGFLFIGVLVSFIFITGATLITYYKQISEGYDDRESYQIMKKVGLPDTLIKRSLRLQILWIFFLPIIIACIHAAVASKILFQLLGLFGMREFSVFAVNLLIVVGVFSVIYMCIYLLTSKIYYKIVS